MIFVIKIIYWNDYIIGPRRSYHNKITATLQKGIFVKLRDWAKYNFAQSHNMVHYNLFDGYFIVVTPAWIYSTTISKGFCHNI
jgi:hypothetical protein